MTIDQKVWDYDSVKFDPVSLKKRYPNLKSYFTGYHESGKKQHPVQSYKMSSADSGIDFHWGICEECMGIRYARIIGYGLDTEGYQTAFVRDIYADGAPVLENL